MANDDGITEVPQPGDKKKKWTWIIAGSTIILVILIVLLYILAINNPQSDTQNSSNSSNSTNTNSTLVSVVIPNSIQDNFRGVIIFVIIVFVVVAIGFVIYAWKNDSFSFNLGSLVKPVYPDVGFELSKRNIAKRNRMNAAIIDDKIVFARINDFVASEDRRIFEKNGNRFLAYEYETRSGLNPGVFVAIVPLSFGEEAIEHGDFNTIHASFNTFQMNSRVFPLVGPRDRIQRYINTVLEEGAEVDEQKIRLLERVSGIGTPSHHFGGSMPYTQSDLRELQQFGEIDPADITQFNFQKKKPRKKVGPSYPKLPYIQ